MMTIRAIHHVAGTGSRFPRRLVAGFTIVTLTIVTALLSFVWTPFDVSAIDIGGKLAPPSANHLLGTDHFGRDILSMIMVGARSALAVALAAVIIGAGIGVPLGFLAAAQRGWISEFIMRGKEPVDMDVGSTHSLEQLVQNTRAKSYPLRRFIGGVDKHGDSILHFRPTCWHYGWRSNKHATNKKHTLRVYLLRRDATTQTATVMSIVDSPEFSLFSSKCLAK